jgi:hypothetical protein
LTVGNDCDIPPRATFQFRSRWRRPPARRDATLREGGFGWQDGYGAFSVSKSQVPDVTEYIRRQREHHRVKSFEEEYRTFLDKHDIQYEERYVFDAELSG